MTLKLVGANVVIVAQQFNPSIISQLWLVRNGLLQEDDFRPGCVFSDMVAQVNASQFRMLVVPDQCQFSPAVPSDQEQALVVDKVGMIARSLPHTPFRAIGLNFLWHLDPADHDVRSVSRDLFFVANSPLYEEFAVQDARFGAYMSKDAFGGRLKLDVKPLTIQHEGRDEERIQFAFNFHLDLGNLEDPVGSIEESLHRWNEVREGSSRIVHLTKREE